MRVVVAIVAAAALLQTVSWAAPADSGLEELLKTLLDRQKEFINATTDDNQSVSNTETITETEIHTPGPSATRTVFVTGAGTANAKKTSTSAIIVTADADPGPHGLSATISDVSGGSGTTGNRSSSSGTALIGAISVSKDGISTTSTIVKTSGDTDKGSSSHILGITSSVGDTGRALGIQESDSEAGPAKKSSAQASQQLGSQVGSVSTSVKVAAGSTSATKPTPAPTQPPSTIELVKKELGLT